MCCVVPNVRQSLMDASRSPLLSSHPPSLLSLRSPLPSPLSPLSLLQVSNDGGARWASGMTIDSPVHFFGGSTTPVSGNRAKEPKR